MLYKILTILLSVIIAINLVGYCFNHISPWIAILLAIGFIYLAIYIFNKQTNKQRENQ